MCWEGFKHLEETINPDKLHLNRRRGGEVQWIPTIFGTKISDRLSRCCTSFVGRYYVSAEAHKFVSADVHRRDRKTGKSVGQTRKRLHATTTGISGQGGYEQESGIDNALRKKINA